MIKLNVDGFIKRFPAIGSALDPDDLSAFIRLLKTQYVEASESLITEGTETSSLYFVWEGELDVVMHAPDGEHKVAVIEPGALLGEISLLSPGEATATVRSEQGCMALHLDVTGLEQFWAERPRAASVFLRELSRIVAQRIHAANDTLWQLTQAPSDDSRALLKAQSTLMQGS